MAFVFFNFIWFLGGLLTGLTSFGGNLFGVPFVLLAYSSKEAILSGCIIGAAISFTLGLAYFKAIIWKDTLLLASSSFLGIPMGVWFLEVAGENMLLISAAIGIFIFLAWEVISGFLKIEKSSISRLWTIPAGFISGVMMSALSMGGPPLALYTFFSHFNKEETISSINMAATITRIATLPLQYMSGLFSNETIYLGAWGSAFSILGIIISIPLVKRMNMRIFRLLILLMLAVSAIILIFRAI